MGVNFQKSFAYGVINLAAVATLVAAMTGPSLATGPAALPIIPGLQVAQASNTSAAQIAPALTQYWFTATYEGSSIVLDGYVPDQVLLTRLSQTFQVDTRNLELASGASSHFAADVDFGLKLLSHLKEGRFSIRSSILTIKGSAKTVTDYTEALSLAATGAPAGSIIALAEIKAPLVSPYIWSAEKSADGSVALAGLVPNEAVRGAIAAGIDKAGPDTMTYASGDPTGFEAASVAGLGLLAQLDSGKVGFDGKTWSLKGTVDTPEKADRAKAAFTASKLGDSGWTYDVASTASAEQPVAAKPAIVAPYTWGAEKSVAGDISFSGYVPDDGFKRFIATRAGHVGKDNSQVGAGAPEGFADNALAGFVALSNLDQGHFGYDNGVWKLSGMAPSETAKVGILKVLTFATDTEAWNIDIDVPAIKPAPADPYIWSVNKAADGAITLSGFVPTAQLRTFLPIRIGGKAKSTLELASGEPAGFIVDALAALEALPLLADGQLGFDGKTWSVKGTLVEKATRDNVISALAGSKTQPAAWTIDVKPAVQPVPEPKAEPAPVVEPKAEPKPEPKVEVKADYRFSASKLTGGAIALSGSVPADAAKSFFGVVAGGVPTTSLTVTAGAPPDFTASATTGLRTLVTLESGDLAFDGAKWSLKGKAATPEAQAGALTATAALPAGKTWLTEIAGPPAIDVCREKLAAFVPENPILFDPASSHLTDASIAALSEVSRYLSACPEAYVYVEGHTDSDGDDNLNLALSVARSEAVIAALAADGVSEVHLYAVGYGESVPIADNKTSAGKKANRRIVFTLMDKPQE